MTEIPLSMPNLGNEIQEAQIDAWHKKVGDSVTAGEHLVTITTPKVTMELEAPASGYLKEIMAEEDDIAAVGEVLAVIAAE